MQYKNVEAILNQKNELFGYIIRGMYDDVACSVFKNYFNNFDNLELEPHQGNISQSSVTYSAYCNDLSLCLGYDLIDVLKQIYNREILLSYTYTRKYEKGSELVCHRDRESCEISVSANLFQNNDIVEPFYLSYKPKKESLPEDIACVNSRKGDIIIFHGMNTDDYEDGIDANNKKGAYHWRDPINNDYILQNFTHYVYADGKYASYALEYTRK